MNSKRRDQLCAMGMKTTLSGEQERMREDIVNFIHMVKFNALRQGLPPPGHIAYDTLMARIDVVEELQSYIDLKW